MIAACCCRACSIEVSGDPVVHAVCHCDNCKRRTGGAFGWSAYFRLDKIVAIKGDLSTYLIGDHNRQTRRFCPDCGTTLYWEADYLPGHVGIAAGCFSEGEIGAPTLTFCTDSQNAWLSLTGDWRARTHPAAGRPASA